MRIGTLIHMFGVLLKILKYLIVNDLQIHNEMRRHGFKCKFLGMLCYLTLNITLRIVLTS